MFYNFHIDAFLHADSKNVNNYRLIGSERLCTIKISNKFAKLKFIKDSTVKTKNLIHFNLQQNYFTDRIFTN